MKPTDLQILRTLAFLVFLLPLLAFSPNGTAVTAKKEVEKDSDPKEWKLAKDKKDIKVYLREVPGSQFKEVKGVIEVEASMKSVIALCLDFDAAKDWVYKCEYVKMLKKISEDEYIYHSKINTPWPLADRDLVARLTIETNPATGVVTMYAKAKPDYIAEQKGIVRVQKMTGTTTLIPLDNGKVKIIQQGHAEPGGNVPAWIANMFLDNGPIHTFKKFNELLPNY